MKKIEEEILKKLGKSQNIPSVIQIPRSVSRNITKPADQEPTWPVGVYTSESAAHVLVGSWDIEFLDLPDSVIEYIGGAVKVGKYTRVA